MRRMIWLLATVLAACGSVQDRAGCAASADCPAGEYCAHTADGNVCWPDGQPPAVSDVTVACGTCLRDGTVTVSAVVTDDHDVGAVEASLDLDPARTVPLTLSGGRWTARVPLGAWPFPAFARPVRATVVARDGARNASAPASADSPAVTRLRWQRAVDGVVVALTPPAIMDDGTIVVGGSTGKLYFVSPTGVNAHDPLPVGTGQITAAPAIGQRAIWVGSEDFSIYGVKLDGSGVIPGVSVASDGPIRVSLAVVDQPAEEWAFGASTGGRIAGASTQANTAKTGITNGYTSGPVIGPSGIVFAANANPVAAGLLRSYGFDGAFTDRWGNATPSVGMTVLATPAVDAAGDVLTGSQDGKLVRVDPAGAVISVCDLSGSAVDSIVILSKGDFVVGDITGLLYRFSPGGTPLWTPEPQLGGAVLSPLVIAGSTQAFIVPTKAGSVFALTDAGAEVWHATLGSGAELRTGNLFTPPGQAAGQLLSEAIFSSADGKLYDVIVDGQLDPAAPWPKAFHDRRNTSNAGTRP